MSSVFRPSASVQLQSSSVPLTMDVGMMLLTVLLGLVLYFVYRMYQTMHYWQNLGIPCDEPHPIEGHMKGERKTISTGEIFQRYYSKFRGTGPFVGFYWFRRPTAFIMEPFLIKHILVKDFRNFTDKILYTNPEDDPISGRLNLIGGHKWKSMRAKLTPTFTSGKIKMMCPTVVKICSEMIDVFNELMSESSIVEVRELLARFTTDVIGTCAFGIECSSLKDPEAEFRVMGRRSLTDMRHGFIGKSFISSFPDLARRLHMKSTPEHIEKFFLRIVKETVTFREENKIRRNDFIDQLIDMKNNPLLKTATGESKSLTIEEMTAQAYVFFNAGYETSSSTMGFALYELAQHLDIQQRVRDEVNAVLAKTNGEVTYEALKEMTYLDQVISETLRLYTVISHVNRLCVEDYVVPGYPKYVIKKGMPVIIPACAIHRDERYYPDPDRFNPDNFTPERVQNRDSAEYLAFGDGPRNCIGLRFGKMNTRIGLAMLLKNFKFSVCDRTPIPMTYSKTSQLTSSASGIFLHVERV